MVTSLAEVWIEILSDPVSRLRLQVTSLAEVWIEIIRLTDTEYELESLPSRKCGLKF